MMGQNVVILLAGFWCFFGLPDKFIWNTHIKAQKIMAQVHKQMIGNMWYLLFMRFWMIISIFISSLSLTLFLSSKQWMESQFQQGSISFHQVHHIYQIGVRILLSSNETVHIKQTNNNKINEISQVGLREDNSYANLTPCHKKVERLFLINTRLKNR